MLQCIKRWSTVFTLQWHRLHQLTVEYKVLTSKNFPQAAIYIKKKTLQGALTLHVAFQGKGIGDEPRNDS